MLLLDEWAEANIEQAMRRGDFDNLPGRGEPLRLDDDVHVPEPLRAAYRLLKNAGFVPPEVSIRREIRQVEDLLAGLDSGAERSVAIKRLNLLLARLGAERRDRIDLNIQDQYYRKLGAKLAR